MRIVTLLSSDFSPKIETNFILSALTVITIKSTLFFQDNIANIMNGLDIKSEKNRINNVCWKPLRWR